MRRFIPWQTKTLALILGLLGLVAVACGSAATATSGPPSTPTPAPTPTAETVASTGSGIQGGDPEFDLSAMVWQGYWLSRDQFGLFVMASGLGIPFAPPMDKMGMAMQMVAQNPDDPAMVPQNMMPLQAIFTSAGPGRVNDPRDFGAMDFEAFRLDPDTFDKTVSVRGQAEEITWDGNGWAITSDRFVPAGAMHLANELNWLGPDLGFVSFPTLGG